MNVSGIIIAGLGMVAHDHGMMSDTQENLCGPIADIVRAAYDGFDGVKGEDLTPEEGDTGKLFAGTVKPFAAQNCQIAKTDVFGTVYSCTWRLDENLPLDDTYAAIASSVESCLDKGIVGEPITFMNMPLLKRVESDGTDNLSAEEPSIIRYYGREIGDMRDVPGQIKISVSTLLYPSVTVGFYALDK